MTTTTDSPYTRADQSPPPRRQAIDHDTATRLATTEYARFGDLLSTLEPADWAVQTECPGWDVRALVAHVVGMAAYAGSAEESGRQQAAAGQLLAQHGGPFIDALTGLQVHERAGRSPRELVEEYAAASAAGAIGRASLPDVVRAQTVPVPQLVNGAVEHWTMGFLTDVVLTRDVWMHRVDVARVAGKELVLTSDHDAVIVADVVAEWAERHGADYRLVLTGPAGGAFERGADGERQTIDAVEFCRALSGRAPQPGLLATSVPF